MKHRIGSVFRLLLTNTGLGLIPTVLALVFSRATLASFAETAFQGFLYANCIGFPSWYLVPRTLCRLRGRSSLLRAMATVGVLVVCAVAGCLAANLVLVSVGIIQISELWKVFGWTVRICLLITVAFGLLTSVIGTLQDRLQSTSNALRQREIAEERAQKMAAEARFASLESRVHPHFLFNTLNSISALIREDPVLAERMIERLSALIRFSLDSELSGLVPLAEELRVVRDYLEIEKVRFGERLRYSVEIGTGTETWQVPPLSVQTLVENSVKYAVGTRREGAAILVRSRIDNGRMRIEVSDDGPGFDPASSLKPGHGLDLLSRRLTALFGAAASLEMAEREGRMCMEISVAA